MKVLYVFLGILTIMIIGCGDSSNNPPVIEGVTSSKMEVAPGEEVTIDVLANDPDGDNVSYKYEANGGEIKGSGKTIQWKSLKEGTYLIKVTVRDDYDHEAQSSISIIVKETLKAEFPIMVNLQVTESRNPDALKKVMNELESRGILKATVFIGKDISDNNCSLVKEIDKKGYEIAAFGNAVNEKGESVQLATLSKAGQEKIISEIKASLENCLGHKVDGFRASRFSQNEDTNRIVKNLNFSWHGSFVSGRSFLPGHENDVIPYLSSEYSLYIIPMIGVEVQPGRVNALCDTSLDGVVENSNQWKDIVKTNLVKKSKEKLPFITEFHPYFLIDNPEWWNSFIELLDWLAKQDVVFVTTMEMAKAYCIPCHEGG